MRRGRIEISPFDRYSIINYGYIVHYSLFTFMLLAMWAMGSFSKGSKNQWDILEVDPEDVPCSPGMEAWFALFIFFCPFAIAVATYASCKAKGNYTRKVYTLETWHRQYEMFTNNDRHVNWPIAFIEISNFLWGLVGSILNSTLANPKSAGKEGALRDCINDYGVNTNLLVFVFLVLSYIHLLRFFLFEVTLVYD